MLVIASPEALAYERGPAEESDVQEQNDDASGLEQLRESLTDAEREELLQFDTSGEINNHANLDSLTEKGLIKSFGRGEELTYDGEWLVSLLKEETQEQLDERFRLWWEREDRSHSV